MIGGLGNFQGPGNFQGHELLTAPGIFQGEPGNFKVLEISRPPGKFQGGPYLRSDTLCKRNGKT